MFLQALHFRVNFLTKPPSCMILRLLWCEKKVPGSDSKVIILFPDHSALKMTHMNMEGPLLFTLYNLTFRSDKTKIVSSNGTIYRKLLIFPLIYIQLNV